MYQTPSTVIKMETLPDELLIRILQYLSVNEIVSKERISIRFKNLVDQVLKSIKVIKDLDYHKDIDQIMKTISRMTNATTIKRTNGYNYDLAGGSLVMTKLANCRPNLTEFIDFTDQAILKYVTSVKCVNANFNGCQINHVFEVSWFNGRRVLEIVSKYPDLQLNLGIDGYEVNIHSINRDSITKLTLTDPRDALKPVKSGNNSSTNNLFKNVQEVNYNSLVDHDWNSFNFMPNLTVITLEVQYQELFKALDIINDNYDNLACLRLTNYVYKFEEEDYKSLEKLIKKPKLVKLTIYSGLEVNKLITDRVIKMVINSSSQECPIRKWKQLFLPGIEIKNQDLIIRKDDDFSLINCDTLISIYKLFPQVKFVQFNQEDEYIPQLVNIVQAMAGSNRKRFVKLIFNYGMCNEHSICF